MKLLPLALALTSFTILGCSSTPENSGPQPTPDEIMAAMMRVGTPGEHHKKLDAFVGTWSARVKMWMDPAAPAQESTGRMINEWMYDGRYLKQSYSGDMGGQPFVGMSLWGYDVGAGEYIGLWVDSMSTGFGVAKGPAPTDGKTFRMVNVATHPMTGKPAESEQIITLDSPNQHTMTMFEQRGSERVQMMEIVYTRAR